MDRATEPRLLYAMNGTKVALITGGAIRVGAALSRGMAGAGYDIALNYHSSAAAAASVKRDIEALGRRCLNLQGDVSSEDNVTRIIDDVESEFGRLDLLINSASVFREGELLRLKASEWDEVMGINLRGPFMMAKAAAPLLLAAGGNIINIVDLSALQPWSRYPHHSVSKAGLLHLTKLMAKEFAPSVRVNAIAPGNVLPPEGWTPAENERDRQKTLLKRLGSPQDVVDAAKFLASASYVTGDVILVDGGRNLER